MPLAFFHGDMIAFATMPLGSVLVIEDDEWVSRLLATAIRDAGYEIIVCATAQAGLETACAVQPDCIICDIDLPDHDGYWVARNVRTHPSRVSVTPFLFLSGLDDEQSRLEGFHVGADVYMTKPFRVDEVIAQAGALVQMADRLRKRRDSMISILPPANSNISAIEGDLSQMSIATVLTVLEMERRSGIFEVVSKKRRASLELSRGYVVQGMVGGTKVSALVALRAMLGWTVGRFSFTPTAPGDPPTSQKSLGAFLIEALRLEDEATRAELELPPSRHKPTEHRLSAPALGGPPSSTMDFAPPSAPSSRAPEFVRSSPSEIPLSFDASELAEWDIPPTKAPPPMKPVLTAPRLPAIPPPGPGARAHVLSPLPMPPAPPRISPPFRPPRPSEPGDKKR